MTQKKNNLLSSFLKAAKTATNALRRFGGCQDRSQVDRLNVQSFKLGSSPIKRPVKTGLLPAMIHHPIIVHEN